MDVHDVVCHGMSYGPYDELVGTSKLGSTRFVSTQEGWEKLEISVALGFSLSVWHG